MTNAICIIPARMASSRFPGKPLAPLLGMPLILHVWHRCLLSGVFSRIIVATCDAEIHDCVSLAGGEAVMTADTHERCTDRVTEADTIVFPGAATQDIITMVQGDEVLVDPPSLALMRDALIEWNADAVNFISPIEDPADGDDVNVVKAVVAPDGRIIYLSRAAVPSRSRSPEAPMFQQTGIIAFRRDFLARFSALPQTPLERHESIDMLRLIEHNLPLYSVTGDRPTIGVDTEQDRQRAEQALADDPHTRRYL